MKLLNLIEEIDPTLKKDNIHYKKLMETVKFLEKKEKRLEIAHLNKHKALKLTMIQTRVVNL